MAREVVFVCALHTPPLTIPASAMYQSRFGGIWQTHDFQDSTLLTARVDNSASRPLLRLDDPVPRREVLMIPQSTEVAIDPRSSQPRIREQYGL